MEYDSHWIIKNYENKNQEEKEYDINLPEIKALYSTRNTNHKWSDEQVKLI
jgi:hypothetical protein